MHKVNLLCEIVVVDTDLLIKFGDTFLQMKFLKVCVVFKPLYNILCVKSLMLTTCSNVYKMNLFCWHTCMV